MMDVAQFFSEMEQSIQRVSRSIRVRLRLGKRLWPVTIAPTQLRRLVLSLARVASRQMRTEGTLTVECQNIEQVFQTNSSQIRSVAEKFVQVQLHAEGSPATKEGLPELREPTGNAKLETSETAAILEEVTTTMNKNGGWLEVEKETTFRLILPTSESEGHSHSHPYQRPHRNGAPSQDSSVRQILVVDDEAALRGIATRLLEASGYQVLTARNGREAVEVFQASQSDIDLILLDLSMPVMSGQEALGVLRAIDPNVRVIICSGEVTEDDQPMRMAQGAKAVISKPYQLTELLDLINRVLV